MINDHTIAVATMYVFVSDLYPLLTLIDFVNVIYLEPWGNMYIQP
jgi:hypothetical protein